jgi:hypothetical protein
MAIDQADFPDGLLKQLLRGLETEQPSEFLTNDLVNLIESPDTLEGTVPIKPSGYTLRRDENRDLAEGAEAKPHDGSLETVAFDAKRQVGYEFIPDGQIIEEDAYNNDAAEDALSGAEAQANLNVDLQIADVLTNLSTTQSATAAFSDETNADPLTDIEDAFDTVPGATHLVMGRTVYNELSQLPDITARISSFDAGGVSEGELENTLINKFGARGLENVHVMEKFYNGAAEGQDYSLSYIMDTEMALYHRDAIHLVRPDHELNPNAESERVVKRSGVEVKYEQRTDCIEAPEDDLAVRFTGI